MATVYLAQDLKHHRKVAIKVLQPELAAALGPERFLREIEIAAGLNHPHILPLYDSGEAAASLYYVMPYLEGETLRDRLNRERQLPLEDALRITREVADALSYAHSHDVVHRDIKPENILFQAGHAVVSDFGIARAITAAVGGSLTATGIAIGTPAYMSPEQASGGGPIDGRSDIYSLGCVLYEMLVGEPPYTGPSAQVVIAKRFTDPVPSVRRLREGVPPAIDGAVSGALAKAAVDRFATAAVFAEALAAPPPVPAPVPRATANEIVHVLDGLTTPRDGTVPSSGPGRRSRIVAGVLAGIVMLAGAAAIVRMRRPAQSTSPIRLVQRRVAVAPFENQTSNRALEPIGHLTSDWITQGLAEAGFAEVVDPQTTQLAMGNTPLSVGGLASATGARLIVSGTYYLEGDSLRFLARVTDASLDKLLRVIGPVTAPAATQGQAIAMLRERVLGAVGGILDVRSGQYAAWSGLPPSLAAYQRWSLGVEHFYKNEFAQAGAEFLASARLDSAFVLPLLWGAAAYINVDSLGKADSLLRVADRSRDRLSPSDRYLLDVKRAELHGDFRTGLEAAREMLRASPGSAVAIIVLAWDALRVNRPREGIAVLRQMDPERPPARVYPPYWDVLTLLEHLEGDYRAELADAMHGRRQYPDRLATLSDEARALAALGRRTDVLRRLDEVIDLPWDPLATPGDVMREIGTELRAHGDGAAADSAFTRALRWYADRPLGEQATVGGRAKVAMTLYVAGHRDEARRIYERLAREDPRAIEYRGYLGVLAARSGHRTEALAVERSLGELRGPSPLGRHTYWRARIAALVGERERAVTLLRESLQQGKEYFPVHLEADFETLRALPSFQELMRVKE